MLRLADINYHMGGETHQRGVLENYARFFNKLGVGEEVTVMIANRRIDRQDLVGRVLFPEPRDGDDLTVWRADHNRVVEAMLGDRDYMIVSEKYLLLTVSAEDVEEATARLERLEASVISDLLQLLSCRAERLNGVARVEFLREWTRGVYAKGFDFEALGLSGASTKDELAPQGVDRRSKSRMVLHGDTEELHFQTLVLRNYPAYLTDDLFARISEISADLVISFNIEPLDRAMAMKLVGSRIGDLKMERTGARRRAINAKLDPNVDLPERLVEGLDETAELRDAMRREGQRLFSTTLLVAVRGSSREELAERVRLVIRAASGEQCQMSGMWGFQEAGLNQVLFGGHRVPVRRTLTTAGVATQVPFASQEILDPEGVFYGLNGRTGNPIVVDRRRKRNGNKFTVGTSGSGKSHLEKWEICEVLIGNPSDELIIIDPEQEYRALGEAWGATIVEVHAASEQTINPFDVEMVNLEGRPLRLKTEAVLGMLEVLLGGDAGLSGEARSVLDRCVSNLYNRWEQTQSSVMPTFVDLWHELRQQPEPAAATAAMKLELYSVGSFSGFAQQTNVDVSNRFVIYDTSKLGHALQNFGLMVVLDSIWQRVQRNYGRGIRSWLWVDEFASMFTNRHAMNQFMEFFQRFRKYGGMASGILQSVTRLLEVEEAVQMLNNAEILVLMGQSDADAKALEELLGLSDQEVRAFRAVEPGCGLIRVGSTSFPLNARKPQDGVLAALFDTSFKDGGRG
ncbi:MAG: DUF87 domain-containing protein [Propionibacteriaceae bacterium]|nr:DUF87 domain-containing protein [Propionibacteriaceae bacterium]